MLLHLRPVVSPVLNKDKHNNHKYGHTTASSESGTAQKLNWIHNASEMFTCYYRHYRDLQTNIALCEVCRLWTGPGSDDQRRGRFRSFVSLPTRVPTYWHRFFIGKSTLQSTNRVQRRLNLWGMLVQRSVTNYKPPTVWRQLVHKCPKFTHRHV